MNEDITISKAQLKHLCLRIMYKSYTRAYLDMIDDAILDDEGKIKQSEKTINELKEYIDNIVEKM